jgi:hypothetical protein
MHRPNFYIVVALSVVGAVAASTPLQAQRPANFGQRWVRSHPLTLMGLQQWPHSFDTTEHRNANMTNVLAWWADGNGKQIAAPASAANLPWHALIVDGEGDERDRIADYASVGKSAGWMIGDELNRQQMLFFSEILAWTKQNRPNDLAYTNAYPTYAGDAVLYGGAPPGGSYGYSQYLEDIVQIMQPDVLMYDHYPYVGNLTRHDYFQNLMLVRDKGLEHDLPYWGFMLSSAHGGYRLPSKADARMQMFSHLAAGFTGMAYFTFDNEPIFQHISILDTAGNPSPLYPIVADLNKEAENLGRALRFMTSTDVKYIAGWHASGAQFVRNAVPLGMAEWTAAGDPDDHIVNITIGAFGLNMDALIGFFTDDNGDEAFMLMNVNHGPNVPAGSQTTMTIRFDDSVQSILELDRFTGQQVVLPVPATHQLTLTFPAGTGRLFKYNDGDFLVDAIPEPASLVSCFLAIALMGPLSCKRSRSSRSVLMHEYAS